MIKFRTIDQFKNVLLTYKEIWNQSLWRVPLFLEKRLEIITNRGYVTRFSLASPIQVILTSATASKISIV